MAGQTPRFALNFFGGDTPGTIDDDAGKYTSEDRLTIDRLFSALEKHTHRITSQLADPADAPDLTLGTDGTLEAGETYYYVISFINSDGLETVSGAEASIDTPDLLEAPDAPSGETGSSTGTLTPGQYYYALTGLRSGEESPLGIPTTVTVLNDEDIVTITLPALGDATTYQVWRMKDTDPSWTRIGTTTSGTLIDDGSVPAAAYGDPANTPPATNSGVDKYSVTIELAGDDLDTVETSAGWRIYRTDVSGTYSAASLVHEVIERTSDIDPEAPLLTSWIDDGDAQLTGSPKLFATELNVAPFTFESASTLPDATGYPDNYPIVDGSGVLSIARSGSWVGVGGQRGVAVYHGTGDPTGSEPPGSANGDLFFDIATGDVYVIDGL